jgi:hypothetical protein
MHYRIYLLGSDEHIRQGHDVECSTDAEAYATIAKVVGGYPAAELWCGSRRVGIGSPRKQMAMQTVGPRVDQHLLDD